MKLVGGILIGAASAALAVWYIGRTRGALVPMALSDLNPFAETGGAVHAQGGRWTHGASGCGAARSYATARIAAPGTWGQA